MALIPSDLNLPEKFVSFHPGQEEAILSLTLSPYRFTLFNAPTGTGKSAIYFSVSELLLQANPSHRTLILVPTKALQSQILSDFEPAGLRSITGHSSYPCAISTYDDDGGLSDLECSRSSSGGKCFYREKVDEILTSHAVVTNPAHWVQLAKSEDPDRLGKFDLLVCDEAHMLADLLSGYLTIALSKPKIKNLFNIDLANLDSDIENYKSLSRHLLTEIKPLQQEYAKDKSTLAYLDRLRIDLTRFLNDKSQYVIKSSPRKIEICPVESHAYMEEYIYRDIPRVILCSATLLKNDASRLGVPSINSEYIEVSSTFNPSRRPIIYCPSYPKINVDYKMGEGEFRVWVNHIDRILAERLELGYKGIIPTISYKRAEEILKRSTHRDYLLTHNSHTARSTIERFKQASGPLVLVSPSVEEGYDFPFDQCRFILVVKLPFIDSRDPVLSAKIKTDKQYRYDETSRSFIQIIGRGWRDPKDWCEIIVIDAHWQWFNQKIKWPSYIKQSFRYSQEIPKPPTWGDA